jgi:hypothetical protein
MPKKPQPFGATLPVVATIASLACAPALAMSAGESSLPGAAGIVDWIGFRDISYDSAELFSYTLVFYALGFGYLTDLVLHDRGFGRILNGIVGATGICIALHFALPHLLGFGRGSETVLFNLTMIVACAGSAVTLVVAAALKGVFMKALRRNLDRLGRAPPPPRIAETVEPLNPRIASALREKP